MSTKQIMSWGRQRCPLNGGKRMAKLHNGRKSFIWLRLWCGWYSRYRTGYEWRLYKCPFVDEGIPASNVVATLIIKAIIYQSISNWMDKSLVLLVWLIYVRIGAPMYTQLVKTRDEPAGRWENRQPRHQVSSLVTSVDIYMLKNGLIYFSRLKRQMGVL